MSENVNYGIDLGTTNSLIARHIEGRVEVLKNPNGFKETLPSVVCYRKNRVVVGDAALAYLENAPGCVFGGFKRKMGTTATFQVASTGASVDPIALSAEVLKELKTFVLDFSAGRLDEVVITVPASFDVVQSDATKQAGIAAGFQHVMLLQEPVAASLAYANRTGMQKDDHRPWLVYDLGGGTFDVALASVSGGEIRILDHEGDNFLGGRDFDDLLISQVIEPYLVQETGLHALQDMRRASSSYNALYHRLLRLAEQARIELSSRPQTTVDMQAELSGKALEVSIPITRPELDALIKPPLLRTIHMIRAMLTRRGLKPADIHQILMVGGVTYTPIVRHLVEEATGILVMLDCDPSNAVAVGAAFYAGVQRRKGGTVAVPDQPLSRLEVRVACAKTSMRDKELVAISVKGETEGLWYRIERQDGGFDSGRRPLTRRCNEDLPLRPDARNVFSFCVYDDRNAVVPTDVEPIAIVHGKYAMRGQPIPHDICIEIDDLVLRRRRLEAVFAKNSTLPVKRTVLRTISKTVQKGSDDSIVINVYEGQADTAPGANRRIGQVRITGHEVERYLIQGSDLHLTIEMNESREIRVTAAPQMTEQEFTQVFRFENRHVDLPHLCTELVELRSTIQRHVGEATQSENYELAAELSGLAEDATVLYCQASRLKADDVTDARFQLDDRKCRLLRQASRLTEDRDIATAQKRYKDQRRDVLDLVADQGTETDRRELASILERQEGVAGSSNPLRLHTAREELAHFAHHIYVRLPGYHRHLFSWLTDQRERLSDPAQAIRLFKQGEEAIVQEDFTRLRVINDQLCALLPDDAKDEMPRQERVGIS